MEDEEIVESSGLFTPVRRYLHRRRMESKLSKLIQAGLAHEQEKLPNGAEPYRRLHAMADDEVTGYCDKYNVNRGDLEAQIPMLRKLKELADPRMKSGLVNPATFIGGVLTIAASLWLLGACTGLFTVGQQFVVHHLSH